MSELAFYIRIVKALEEIEAPYMIVGAFAATSFGLYRATYDIDILVDLRDEDFDALAEKFPLPRYYADPQMMRNWTRMGLMFNIIDTNEGAKADLVPMTREPGYQVAFNRCIRRTFEDEQGNTFEAWCAQPTDIIIGKLKAWTEGRSNKHPDDIRAVLYFIFSGLSEEPVNLPEIEQEAARLSPETLQLWQALVARAERDARQEE
ncbi:MAG: hypothetical protein ACE5GO_02255 [Anaerolineales bacterium]